MHFLPKLFAPAALLLLAAAPAARAQDVYDLSITAATQNAYMSSHIANLALADIASGRAHVNSQKGINVGRPGPGSGSATAPAVSNARFAYSPTAALKQQTVQGYVDRLKTKNPAASQAIAAKLGPGKLDYAKIYQGLVADAGMPENDAASALASYLILGWMITNNVRSDKAVTPAMAAGVRRQVAAQLSQSPQMTAPGVPAQLGEEMKLLTVVVQSGWQSAIKENTLPAYRQDVAGLFKNRYGMDFAQVKLTPQGFAGAAAGPGTTGAARPAAATPVVPGPAAATVPAAASGSGPAAGAQWFFRAVSGGSAVVFEPVVLLAGGAYFDIGDEPLETLNVAAAKAARPAAWGSWRKNGAAFVLTNYRGQTSSYTLGSGNWFPAYAAGAVPLKRAYERTGGGSVGVATVLSISKIQFLDGGRFQMGENTGISAPNAYGGRTGGGGGIYRLQGHTLTLTFAGGRTVRKSFAIGASGSPARPANTIIFIGGDAYTDE